MPVGYTFQLANANKEANQSLLGVRLGRVCINKDIPVADVAEYFDVSRVTIYAWFGGKAILSGKHVEKAQKIIARFS